jgi:hypothetical protein
MTQAVKHLLCKHKALSSNPSATKNNKENKYSKTKTKQIFRMEMLNKNTETKTEWRCFIIPPGLSFCSLLDVASGG